MNTCTNIICLDKKPEWKGKIFFDEYDKLIRIDNMYTEAVIRLRENAESNTWFVSQINFSQDIVGWERIPDVAKRMFLYNINYQNAMDSGVVNGFLNVYAPILSDPTWQLLIVRIGYEESIHAMSYSHGLSLMFGPKATEYIDMVYSDPFIKQRLAKEVDAFSDVKHRLLDVYSRRKFWNSIKDRLPESVKQEIEDTNTDLYETLENDDNKLAIVRMITALLFLEGIKFPLSFYVTWNIHNQYNSAINGMDALLKEIAHDELNTHVPTGTLLLKILRTDSSQGFSHLWDKGLVQEMTLDLLNYIIDQEDKWIDFLCEEGEIPGFTKEIGRHFIRYWADERLRRIGLDPIYKEEQSDIIKWFKEYSDVNVYNAALQETDNLSYQADGLTNDYNKDEFMKKVKDLGIEY